jgi:DNA-binding GntR family transcriptional regulator
VVLREMIVSGELPPGERLREVAISEKMNMSRTPIREAFRTLAAEGLVSLLPNRSVVVSELDESEATDVFAALGALEAVAAQQASQRMTTEQIEEIGRLQIELEHEFDDSDRSRYTETNRRIHELIVTGSSNVSLILAWRLILPRAERARTLNTLDRGRWAAAVEAHRQIYAALVARDASALRSLMFEHFDEKIIAKLARRYDNGGNRSRRRSVAASPSAPAP